MTIVKRNSIQTPSPGLQRQQRQEFYKLTGKFQGPEGFRGKRFSKTRRLTHKL
jgi:hypothetical protein